MTPIAPQSAARATKATQYAAGIDPRDFQLDTTGNETPQIRATSPVPPSSEMIVAASITQHDISRPVNLSSLHELAGDGTPPQCLNFHMTNDGDEIARRLRLFQLAKLEAGENQAETAASLELKDNRWSQYLSGKRPLTLAAARRLYAVHSLSLDWLYENNPKGLDDDLRRAVFKIGLQNPDATIVNIRGRKPTPAKISRRVKKKA